MGGPEQQGTGSRKSAGCSFGGLQPKIWGGVGGGHRHEGGRGGQAATVLRGARYTTRNWRAATNWQQKICCRHLGGLWSEKAKMA